MTTSIVFSIRGGGKALFLSLLLPLSMLLSFNSFAQNVPHLITYQGSLVSAGKPANGEHQVTARLYTNPEANTALWEGAYTTFVTDGIFALVLGAGKYPLPELTKLDKQLWIGISVDGGEELRPLTQLTSSPYALNVPDKSITKAKLSDDVLLGINHVGGGQDPQVSPNWTNAGDAYGCSGEVLGTANPGGCDLVLVTYGSQAMRYQFNSTSNEILGGYSGNTINNNGAGNVIAGGGQSGQINRIGSNATSNFGVIGGGIANILDGNPGAIGGGEGNTIAGNWDVIAGGKSNSISGGSTPDYSAILGGTGNSISGQYSSILGGLNLTLSGDKVIGFNGGTAITFAGSNAMFLNDADLLLSNNTNTARKLIFCEASGSGSNVTTFKAQAQSADINYLLPSTLGSTNQVLALTGVFGSTGTLGWAAAGGGGWQLIGNSGLTDGVDNLFGTLGNVPILILTNNTERARILSTGEVGIGTSTPATPLHILLTNSTTNAVDNVLTIGHNSSGTAANGFGSGINFQLESSTTDNRNIGQIKFSWVDAADATRRGAFDLLLPNAANPQRVWRIEYINDAGPNVIGGDAGNNIPATIPIVYGGTISGGGKFDFPNIVTDFYGTVSGGVGNQAGDNDAYGLTAGYTTVGGGILNTASAYDATVGGGWFNTASGQSSTIPGGEGLIAQSYAQTVIGRHNIKQGTSTSPGSYPITSIVADDRIFIIGNGTPTVSGHPGVLSNAYEVSNNGHSIVYHNNGSAAAKVIQGARYIDNTPIAWGFIDGTTNPPTIASGFGITNVALGPGAGTFTIDLTYVDPYSGNQKQILTNQSSVVSTLEDDGNDYCSYIKSKPVVWNGAINQVTIRTFWKNITQDADKIIHVNCEEVPRSFMFVVFGRP